MIQPSDAGIRQMVEQAVGTGDVAAVVFDDNGGVLVHRDGGMIGWQICYRRLYSGLLPRPFLRAVPRDATEEVDSTWVLAESQMAQVRAARATLAQEQRKRRRGCGWPRA
jgi:hypothetical protein